jgi:glycosyltransferase involved in cell wall biosynthesis
MGIFNPNSLTLNFERMKLLVIGLEHPEHVRSWSGIPHHLSRALAKHFELCFVGDFYGPAASLHQFIFRIYRRLGWGVYRIRSEPAVLKEFVRRVEDAIKREKPDAILSICCEPIAFLPPGLPAYLVHDSTFHLNLHHYPASKDFCRRARKTAEEAQNRAFARSTLTFASSQWAKKSACQDYGLPSSKVKVIPFGANLVDAPSAEEVAEAIEKRLASDCFDFLFVGVEWERKGGDTAVSIVEALVHRGLNARLHLVGCTPPATVLEKSFVLSHGFLSKNKPDERTQLNSLFESARFFIVPSIAECYGCVFCEAAAYGLPSIARKTGGIPEIIKSESTGFLLSDELLEERIVELVLDLSRNPTQYREMALRARADYEARLNWDAYASKLKELLLAASVA